MLAALIPKQMNNAYQGSKIALWLLALFLLMKLGISLGSIFNGRAAAGSADGIPLHTFTPAGAQTVVTLFALLGISNLMLCLVGMVVLIRYRVFVPLVFSLLLVEHLSRKLALLLLPIERTGTPPGSIISLVFLGLLCLGLGFSLRRRQGRLGLK